MTPKDFANAIIDRGRFLAMPGTEIRDVALARLTIAEILEYAWTMGREHGDAEGYMRGIAEKRKERGKKGGGRG